MKLMVIFFACLAYANAGLWGVGIVAPRHNQWGDVGPSGVVTGAGAAGPSGIVNGAGAKGPAGIVNGHGAVSLAGQSSAIRDDNIGVIAPIAVRPIVPLIAGIGGWNDGRWNDGRWDDGRWDDGRWDDGKWDDGRWDNGKWDDGRWNGNKW